MERAFLIPVRLLPIGLAVGLVGLAVSVTDNPLIILIGHLTLLVAASLMVTHRMAQHTDQPWLDHTNLRPMWKAFWSGGTVVAFATGFIALITLASSAAMRYEPSLQFLQLLSALDIAWVCAATYIGVRWLKGTGIALIAGAGIGALCIWSIWNYLRIVGFSATGGWVVDGPALMRYVIPFDMAAAVIAVGLLLNGSRYFTAQRSPQSYG